MSSPVLPETEPQIHPRNPFARPGPIPDSRLEGLFVERPVPLVARNDDASSSSSSNSSSSGGGGSSTTLPIVLGVVIPIGIALCVLLYLHRRHVNKLKREDAEDKHKSLDFGLNSTPQKAPDAGRNAPQMTEQKGIARKLRGLSMDMGISNPFLLPPELQHSRESLHSLSRSLNTGDDKYRNTTFIPDDGSVRPPSSLRSPVDDSSSYAGSNFRFQVDSKQNLLRHGQDNPTGGRNASAESVPDTTRSAAQRSNANLLAPAAAAIERESYMSTTSSNGAFSALRASNNYLAQFIKGCNVGPQEELDKKEIVAVTTEIKVDSPTEKVLPPPPAVVRDSQYNGRSHAAPAVSHHQSTPSTTPSITVSQPAESQPTLAQLSPIDSQSVNQSSIDGQINPPAVSTPAANTPQHSTAPSVDKVQQRHRDVAQEQLVNQGQQAQHVDDYYDEYEDYGAQEYQDYQEYQEYLGYDPRRLTMGMRPLPPDDPTENPEQRANRIRSFYKEYFDETKPQSPNPNVQYYDGAEGFYDSQPPTGHYQQEAYYAPRRQPQNGPPGRHRATFSNGSYMSHPRAFSSASGRPGMAPPSMRPKKKLPPPKPLNVLPTPHMLKDDLFLPTDFAPPQKFQNQRSGTPDSLRGGVRTYRPGVRAHVPLASSFDDLAVIPSP